MAQANWYKTSNPGGLEQNAYGYEWTVSIDDDNPVYSPSFEWPVTEGFTIIFKSGLDGTATTTAAKVQGDVTSTFANAMDLQTISSIDLDDEALESYYYAITHGVCPFMRIELEQGASPSSAFSVTVTIIPHTI